MTLRKAAQAILDWLDAEEIWHPKQLSDDLRAALAEPREKYTYGTPILDEAIKTFAPERALVDAALLAPEPGQLKDRGAK